MRVSVSQVLIVAVLYTATFMFATPGHAQTAGVPAASKLVPTSQASQPTSTASEELQRSDLGATAQCRDGTFFHGKPGQGTCFDHGCVRKWLGGRLQ